MSTKINLYKQSGTDVDTRVSFNVPRSLTYGLNARANDDGGVSESDNCEYNILNTLYGINYEPIPIQPETAAYLAATGITGTTEVNAINKLVYELKQNNLWSKMKAVYPFVTDNRNLLGYTEDFSNGYWAKTNATVTTNTTTDPNGGTNADTITDNTTNGQHKVQTSDITTTVGTGNTFVVSGYFKANTATRVCIYAYGSSKGVGVDLTNGTQITVNGLNNASASDITITADNYGFYRVTMKGTVAGAFSIAIFVISGNDFSYAGTGTSLYKYGAQLELGSTATTYQPIATTQQAYILSQFKYNLVNPVDSDAAFRLVFNGGWTHSSNGATPNGTNGYADTKLVPSSSLSTTSAHFTTYLRTNSTGATCDIGSYLFNARMILYSRYPSSETYATISNSGYPIGVPFPTTDSTGLWQTIRENNTNTKIFQNTIKKADGAIAFSTLPNVPFYIGAINNTSVASLFSNRQTAFSTIGDGLTDTEATILYSLVQQYQTFLNRAV